MIWHDPPNYLSPSAPLPSLTPPVVPGLRPGVAGSGRRRAWPAVIVIIIVLASATAMLLTGRPVHDALLLAGGLTLLGSEITKRIITDSGMLPTVVATCAVTGFATVLVICGYPIGDVAMIVGVTGLIAGEAAAWILRMPAPRMGV